MRILENLAALDINCFEAKLAFGNHKKNIGIFFELVISFCWNLAFFQMRFTSTDHCVHFSLPHLYSWLVVQIKQFAIAIYRLLYFRFFDIHSDLKFRKSIKHIIFFGEIKLKLVPQVGNSITHLILVCILIIPKKCSIICPKHINLFTVCLKKQYKHLLSRCLLYL